ncbi:pilus assembly protein TadG-related protein [Paeniglutamicibacter sulfureus]|uniref:pilus assembly protein TadG-related protein n=1 Tax=Paeniglutamicibacter sulfureus TaxID=43666 RepID=UPI00266572A5|nr:pilus assembly protein TadG-related protein [Paeniglutamicibacter sulfureus]MDO2933286.1 pilus assembly protein TadG-related protein [Paeniglutamicibacter sulfureus]
MRWITRTPTSNQRDSERGASAIIVAIVMVALLGFAAISIDVGRIYWERVQLQNGADSAAISVALDCSKGACTAGEATAPGFANDNANDAHTKIESITYPKPGTVRVTTGALSASGNEGLGMTFANIFGLSEVSVPATAEASWGPPKTTASFPWTAPLCAFKSLLSQEQLDDLAEFGHFDGAPSNERITLRSDKNAPEIPECVGQPGYVNGGFAWIDYDAANCQATIDLSSGDPVAGSDPGNNIPQTCKDALDNAMDHPILFPIFDTSSGTGNTGTYDIYGHGAFQITGYQFSGYTKIDPLAPPCDGGNARCLQGFFTLYSEMGDGGEISTGPSLGGTVVRLTK